MNGKRSFPLTHRKGREEKLNLKKKKRKHYKTTYLSHIERKKKNAIFFFFFFGKRAFNFLASTSASTFINLRPTMCFKYSNLPIYPFILELGKKTFSSFLHPRFQSDPFWPNNEQVLQYWIRSHQPLKYQDFLKNSQFNFSKTEKYLT